MINIEYLIYQFFYFLLSYLFLAYNYIPLIVSSITISVVSLSDLYVDDLFYFILASVIKDLNVVIACDLVNILSQIIFYFGIKPTIIVMINSIIIYYFAIECKLLNNNNKKNNTENQYTILSNTYLSGIKNKIKTIFLYIYNSYQDVIKPLNTNKYQLIISEHSKNTRNKSMTFFGSKLLDWYFKTTITDLNIKQPLNNYMDDYDQYDDLNEESVGQTVSQPIALVKSEQVVQTEEIKPTREELKASYKQKLAQKRQTRNGNSAVPMTQQNQPTQINTNMVKQMMMNKDLMSSMSSLLSDKSNFDVQQLQSMMSDPTTMSAISNMINNGNK